MFITFRRVLLMLFLSTSLAFHANATHISAGSLSYEPVGPNQYHFTLKLLRDCNGIGPPASRYISFTSGLGSGGVTATRTSVTEISNLFCPSAPSSCAGGAGAYGFEVATYEATLTLPAGGSDYVFSARVCCMANSITNLITPGSEAFHIETTLDNTLPQPNTSPVYSGGLVTFVGNGQPTSYNLAAYDADGDSLSYQWVDAIENTANTVEYAAGYSGTSPMDITPAGPMPMDATSGQVDFTPNGTQVAVMCALVTEWRDGVAIATQRRQFLAYVINTPNSFPTSTGIVGNVSGATQLEPDSLRICAGTSTAFEMTFSDPDAGDALTLSSNVNDIFPSATVTQTGTNPATLRVELTADLSQVGLHMLVLTASDDNCDLRNTVKKSVFLRVTGAPVLTWTGSTDNNWFEGENWSPAPCVPNATTDAIIPASAAPVMPLLDGAATGFIPANVRSITIEAGASISQTEANSLRVHQDYVNNGTHSTTNTELKFEGSGTQSYFSVNPLGGLYLVLNNGSTLTLNSDMVLSPSTQLVFQNAKGIIETGTNGVEIHNTASNAITGHDANGYIDGNLRRHISTSTAQSYAFPLGVNGGIGYQGSAVSFTTAPGFNYLDGYFETFVSAGNPTFSLTNCAQQYNCYLSNHGKWVFEPSAGATGVYDITLNPLAGVPTCGNTWTIAKQPTGAGNSWAFQGDACNDLVSGASPTAVTRRNLTSFSEFILAGSTDPLDVEGLALSALPVSDAVQLTWQTTRETNNRGFWLQRSTDGETFANVSWTDGAGSTKERQIYAYNDVDVLAQQMYFYRLQQEDFDGSTSFSNLVEVRLDDAGGWRVGLPTPNPTSGQLEVPVQLGSAGDITYRVVDILGREVIAPQTAEFDAGANTLALDLGDQPAGVYLLELSHVGARRQLRVVVE